MLERKEKTSKERKHFVRTIEQTEFWEKRAKNKGRARKREIHPFAVDFAKLR